jgi:hypothetical protein
VKTPREVAELSIHLMRHTPDHDVYLDEFAAAIETRDAEHAADLERTTGERAESDARLGASLAERDHLRDALKVAAEALTLIKRDWSDTQVKREGAVACDPADTAYAALTAIRKLVP